MNFILSAQNVCAKSRLKCQDGHFSLSQAIEFRQQASPTLNGSASLCVQPEWQVKHEPPEIARYSDILSRKFRE
ncbi:MAG: hypothetical protein WA156_04520, partial [Methylocystis silviterrae]